MTEPDTVDPAALKAEANPDEDGSAPITLEWDGVTYTVESNAELWPVTVVEAFEDGKSVTAIRGIIGAKQWATYKAGNPNTRAMGRFFDAIAKACGLTSAGE